MNQAAVRRCIERPTYLGVAIGSGTLLLSRGREGVIDWFQRLTLKASRFIRCEREPPSQALTCPVITGDR